MSREGACLIAGCGDLGMRLGRLLVAQGQRVYGLRRSDTPLPQGILPLQGDLTEPSTLHGLPDDIRQVVFVAAPAARDEHAYRAVYSSGLQHLLSALDERTLVGRFVLVSSSAVYGEHGGDWVDEDSECRPLAFNGRVLLQSEQWLRSHLPGAVIARCAGLYGPARSHLIDLIAAGTARAPVSPNEYSNRIHVDDAARALAHLLALDETSGCYLLSDDEPATLTSVYAYIASRLGVPPPGTANSAIARAVGNKRLSNRRLRQSGFAFTYPDFRSGYQQVLAPRI